MTARERKLQLIGWALFVVSALLYTAAGIRNRDPLGLLGALVFLLACAMFLAALLRR